MNEVNLVRQRIHVQPVQRPRNLVPRIQRVSQRLQAKPLRAVRFGSFRVGVLDGRVSYASEILIRKPAAFPRVAQLHLRHIPPRDSAAAENGSGSERLSRVGPWAVLNDMPRPEAVAELIDWMPTHNPLSAPADFDFDSAAFGSRVGHYSQKPIAFRMRNPASRHGNERARGRVSQSGRACRRHVESIQSVDDFLFRFYRDAG